PDRRARVPSEIDVREFRGHVVRPRPDDDTMNARVAPQLAERRQIAFDERVVPAPHREYGYVDLIQVNAGTEGLPERIVAGMVQSILKHVTPLACARKIRPAQRQRAD